MCIFELIHLRSSVQFIYYVKWQKKDLQKKNRLMCWYKEMGKRMCSISWLPHLKRLKWNVVEVFKPHALFRPELTSLHRANPTSDTENQPVNLLLHTTVCQSWFPSSSVCVVDYVESGSSRRHQRQNRWSHVCQPGLMPVDLQYSPSVPESATTTDSANSCSTGIRSQWSCIVSL